MTGEGIWELVGRVGGTCVVEMLNRGDSWGRVLLWDVGHGGETKERGRRLGMKSRRMELLSILGIVSCLLIFPNYPDSTNPYWKYNSIPAHSTPFPRSRRMFWRVPQTRNPSGDDAAPAEFRSSLSGILVSSPLCFLILVGYACAPGALVYNQV